MRQEEERFRLSIDRRAVSGSGPLGADTNPPRGWNRIDTSGETFRLDSHSGDPAQRETPESLRVLDNERRFWSSQNDGRIENNKESVGKEGSRKTDVQKHDGFEPFVKNGDNGEQGDKEELFVNLYGGSYSQKMKLNRRGVERALKIAHLEGQVFLTTLAPSRSRAEAQGNELAAKRFLLFERKTQKAKEENPLKRVVSVPEGWRIEINDQRLTDELTEKKLAGQELQRAFIQRFNGQFKDALKECVWMEKLSSEKDKSFRGKAFFSLINPTGGFILSALDKFDPATVAIATGSALIVFSALNSLTRLFSPLPLPFGRNIDHVWEFLMSSIEIDKVGRTFAYLEGKGRRLVREARKK